MEEDLDILLDGGEKPAYDGKRPPFLTVICILSFVGTGLGVIFAIYTLWLYSTMESLYEGFDMMDNFDNDNTFVNAYRWGKISGIASILANIVCLAGAIIMFTMRKFGFYIYVFGQAVPLVISFLSIGSTFGGILGSMGIFQLIVYSIFPIGFVIMYGLNLKHMR